MMRRLMESVEAKRRGEKQGGFTLIELIVVVVIIGILSAIAIPSFLSQRTRAFNAAVVSDSRNVAVEMESFFAGNLEYPGADEATATTGPLASVNISNEVTLNVIVDNTARNGNGQFYIVGSHARTNEVFLLDSTGGQAPVETDIDDLPNEAVTFTIEAADGVTTISAGGTLPAAPTP